MSELTSAEIDHLATLSRLSLTDEEKAHFASQLPKIVEFVDSLGAVSGQDEVEATAKVNLESLRDDEVSSDRLGLEAIARLAPHFDRESAQVIVPQVIGGGDE